MSGSIKPPRSAPFQTESAAIPHFDRLSELTLYLMVLFSPWAFGTTQAWAVSVMNSASFVLSSFWMAKIILRFRARRVHPEFVPPPGNWISIALAALTVLVLLYVLIGAWNARAVYVAREWRFEYRPYIAWLPHSYDQQRSWQWFWNDLALALSFWSVRDWLLHDHEKAEGKMPRWQRLLWIIAINGALVALQGLLQRAEGSNKLLWLVEPRVNKSPDSFFGPFAYRANAAQFLNLIWPMTLGLWCALQRPSRGRKPMRSRHLLLPLAALTAIAPVVSASRGGALVTGLCVAASCLILIIFQKQSRGWRLGVVIVGSVILLFGWILGGDILQSRMQQLDSGFAIRESMFQTARAISRDYPLFGTGAGSFDAIFQLYRSSSEEYWPAQLHHDWLETLITYGWLGASFVWAALALVFVRPFLVGNGIRMDRSVILFLWVALGGCLIHARYDFPFQIYSILFLFMMNCAVLSSLTLTRKQARSST